MDFWKRAQELKDEITQNRRRIHQNAEVGLNLPNTKAFVMEKLCEYGLKPTECGHGVTATLGKPGKTLLLRADMDAHRPLPGRGGGGGASRLPAPPAKRLMPADTICTRRCC